MFGTTFNPSGGGDGGGGLTLIQDIQLIAAGPVFQFNNIPQTFKHLKIVSYLRDVGITSVATVRFNGSVANIYSSIISYFRAPAFIGTVEVVNGTQGDMLSSAFNAGDIANLFRVTESIIPDYTNNFGFKSWVGPAHAGYTSAANNIYIYFFGGHWKSIAPITSLSIQEKAGANFMAGSRVSLYGMA